MSLGPQMTVIAQIALDLPLKFNTRDLLNALIRAERAGFERGCEEHGITPDDAPAPLGLGPLEPDQACRMAVL